jgi:hypothetical protein
MLEVLNEYLVKGGLPIDVAEPVAMRAQKSMESLRVSMVTEKLSNLSRDNFTCK